LGTGFSKRYKQSLGGIMAKELWGGEWTNQKLDAFEKYVKAYLAIMNSYRDKYDWQLVYFDAFAGSGTRGIEQEKEFFNELGITEEELSVYKGAAERVIGIKQRGFDYYYFIENDADSKNKLESRLNELNKEQNRNLIYRTTDANKQIVELAKDMKNNYRLRALILLDPFGMQVNWDSIQQLEGTHADLWILIPSGVIINRLLDRQGKLTHIEKLKSFFGLSESQIRDFFYKNESQTTLFGEETIVQKISQPISKISELYIKRLGTIFKEPAKKSLEMKNGRNVSIYHFVFASNNKTATKIAGEIIGKE
jgi:three-Cys-motif partner protein